MTDEIENLVLEQLRLIRRDQLVMMADVGDLKVRLSTMEEQQGQLFTLLGSLAKRMDRLEERLAH